MTYDVVIVGAGPAGCAAAIYAKRSGLKTLLVEKGLVGGYIVNASSLENYPGFKSISGMDFGEKLKEQLVNLEVEIIKDEVIHLDLEEEVKKVKTHDDVFETKTIILASGSEHRKLEIEGGDKFMGKGVSFCATCDAPFFKDKTVAVVGGGNSAVDEALHLSEIASKVYLIHRRDMLRAEAIRQKELEEKKVEILFNTEVLEIRGIVMVESIRVRNNVDNSESEMLVNGVFISIGQVPSTLVAKEAGVEIDERGFIKTDKKQRTNIPGVYAAGDVTGGVRQVTTAVGEGAVAAVSAFDYLKKPYWGDNIQ